MTMYELHPSGDHEWNVVGQPFCVTDGCDARAYVVGVEDWNKLVNDISRETVERIRAAFVAQYGERYASDHESIFDAEAER